MSRSVCPDCGGGWTFDFAERRVYCKTCEMVNAVAAELFTASEPAPSAAAVDPGGEQVTSGPRAHESSVRSSPPPRPPEPEQPQPQLEKE